MGASRDRISNRSVLLVSENGVFIARARGLCVFFRVQQPDTLGSAR